MLDIIPVIHVGGTNEYRYHPGKVAPTSDEFAVKETSAYLINIASNRRNFNPRHVTAKNRPVFCDSGGLQLGTVGYNKDVPGPRDVMEWQNLNCQNAFVLDDLSPFRLPGDDKLPIPVLTGRIKASGLNDQFKKSAESTRYNINQMMKVKDEKVKLFCIVHGYSIEQLDYFLEVVQKDHDLDGFGLKAVSPTTAIKNLAWAWDNVDKPLHILGVGKLGRTYPLIYWSTKFKHTMTGDSTTWYSGAMFRKFYKHMGDLTYATPDGKPTGPPLLACTCQVCEWGNQLLEDGLRQEQYLFAHILSTHNWQMMMDDHKYASVLARKPELFMEHAEQFRLVTEDTGTIMEDRIRAHDVVAAVDMIHDGDGDKAIQQYCNRTQSAEAFF